MPDDWDGFRAAYESVAAEGRWILGEVPVDWDGRRAAWDEATASDRHLNLVAVDDDGGRLVGWLSIELRAWGRAELGMGVVDGYRDDGSLWDCLAMGLVLDEESPGGPPS